ncbi:MAG: NTF2-like N-terminal transpeptidase domain-containing protein [bacterium]|nr:NTF2-like N-terminal transpeptidase domain-containing protein [bacterium]
MSQPSFFKKRNPFIIFCLAIFFLQLGQLLYFKRNVFFTPYDISYWKDRFEHSQWQLPLSKRGIGDDSLFSYVGYQLINGADPAGVNAETPPVGKYLIGFSIAIFKNPVYYAFFFGIGTIFLYHLVLKNFFKEGKILLFLPALIFLDPLFFSQLFPSWLDIVQLFFLLANLTLFLKFSQTPKNKKSLGLIIASGVTLGLFAESKLPILLPAVLLLEIIYLLSKRFLKESVIFLSAIIAAIILSYGRYFLLGHSLIDFIKLQKYIIFFYLQSKLDIHVGAIWSTLIWGKFPDIATGEPIFINEWWIFWPIVTFLGVGAAFFYLLRKKTPVALRGLSIFLLSTLLIYTFIPIYPRYLLTILPFLYLFSGYVIYQLAGKTTQKIIFTTVLLYGSVHTTLFFLATPDPFLKNFYHNLSHQYFQDIYQENLTKNDRFRVSREEFHLIAKNALQQATIKSVDVKEEERIIPKIGNKGLIKLNLTYKTQDLGVFSERKIIELIKENSQWKIKWNWDIILNEFQPGYIVETEMILGKRGKILNGQGKILAQDIQGYLISVNPEKIDTRKEKEMLDLIGEIGYKPPVNLQNAYLENIPPETDVPLVTSYLPLPEEVRKTLLAFPGLTITDYPSRVYKNMDPKSIDNTSFEECCTRIYSSYNYHGIFGPEKEFDKNLSGSSGGRILMKGKDGRVIRIISEKPPKNGEDIKLSSIIDEVN